VVGVYRRLRLQTNRLIDPIAQTFPRLLRSAPHGDARGVVKP
jgi:hypothetical protein